MIKEKEELSRALLDERKKTEREMEKVYRSYMEDEIDSKTFGSLYRPKTERINQMDVQIPDLQGEIDFLRIQYLSSDQVLNDAKDLYSRWPELATEEKRKIIENITDKIFIGSEDVTINLCYLPSSSEMMADRQRNLSRSATAPA